MGFWSIFGKGKAAPLAQGAAPAPGVAPEPARGPEAAPSNDPVALLARLGEPGGPGEAEAMAAFEALRASPHEGRAIDLLTRKRELLPERLRVACASALVDRGDRGGAWSLIEGATSPEGLLLASDLARERGDLPLAVARIERVLVRSYDHPGARERHARWRQELGLDRDARSKDASATTMVARDTDAPFRILREVARGGSGAVYEAEDHELGRHVALKMYHEPDRDRSQLESEAKAACAFEGPGALRVFDVDPEHGWIAYEWARYGAVRDYVRARDMAFLLPLERWLLPLAQALARVHMGGYVHNDVKPANVLFLAPELPVLADFGIARKLGEPSPRGSMGYMSPERLAGRVSDPRDDVYGFGRLLEDVLAHVSDAVTSQRFGAVAAACVGADLARPTDGRALLTRLRVEWGVL